MKKADWPDYAGLRQYNRSRVTGHYVGVYDGEAAGMDTEGGRWQTVCEPHGAILCHETLALAKAFAPDGDEWCEECRAELEREPGCKCMVEYDGDERKYRVVTHSSDCPTVAWLKED